MLLRLIAILCLFACPFHASGDGHAVYDSCRGLVMAGYQGWFNTPDDGAGRGWRHYNGKGGFKPGSCSIDFWPDVSEYSKTYETEFRDASGRVARVFSSHDPSTVDTHFRWMKEYGIDGAYMQRFVGEISHPSGKKHFDMVLRSAFDSAARHGRAVCIMYDLSGMGPQGVQVLLDDARSLLGAYALGERRQVPAYLFHRGRPLIAVWGAGFNDNRPYGLREVEEIVDGLHAMGFSVMLGVPAYWRTLDHDAVADENLHRIIGKVDVIMPWFVGRYDRRSFAGFGKRIGEDLAWCRARGVDYIPLCFPGFSWKNMKGEDSRQIAREKGGFFWDQVRGMAVAGADALYIAMFDEVDEGTAIFKCANRKELPLNEPAGFQGIDDDLPKDHYLWLAGQAARYLKRGVVPPAQPPSRRGVQSSSVLERSR